MKTHELRKRFLDYFEACGHERVGSSSLIPHDDPSLMFTNAGMNQFKDVFLGQDRRSYSRATSSQLCVRAGGKHNDLDNVGYTARHHTLFEMLGNFSFGDYFKEDAIRFAWDFITQSLGISPDKLYVTVFEDDDEAAKIWGQSIGVKKERIIRCGEKDNFWSMGDTGPCGPCTEIFYDHGPEIEGGLPGTPDQDKDRYVEIWNLVFMQYNRDANGTLTPLPKPSVDTGMGLERMAAVMQGVHNNYDIDLFQDLIKAAASVLSCKDLHHSALKVIADHLRTSVFLIAEGLVPSNEGRGYVLRRIMRRALRHGYELCGHTQFMDKLVPVIVEAMGESYPLLKERQSAVQDTIAREQVQFGQTLSFGIRYLEQALSSSEQSVLPGHIAFKLYDTYGFPYDLTESMCVEKGIRVDFPGFEEAMSKQKALSKQYQKFVQKESLPLDDVDPSEFIGYELTSSQGKIMAMINHGQRCEHMRQAEKGWVIVDKTPFYPEGGGQIGDCGEITWSQGVFRVTDTQKVGQVILHQGELLEGELKLGNTVMLGVSDVRAQTKKHHSATHLLHAALHAILGEGVNQKGSLVSPERLRFDFAFHRPVTREELCLIEDWGNRLIQKNIKVTTEILPIEEAKAKGAMALFGEKYDDHVRVLSMGDASIELCGGTHVDQTSDINLIKITGESAVASGVRRIEAVAGSAALDWINKHLSYLESSAQVFQVPPKELRHRIEVSQRQDQEKDQLLHSLKQQLALQELTTLEANQSAIAGRKVCVQLTELEAAEMRLLSDEWVKKNPDSLLVLASASSPHTLLIQRGQNSDVHVGQLLKSLMQSLGGRGGGKPHFAQGGGVKSLDHARVTALLEELLVK